MASSITINPGGLSTYNTNGYIASEAELGALAGTGRRRVKEIRFRLKSTAGATLFLMVFNQATVPGNGATPARIPLVATPGSMVSVTYPSDNEGRIPSGAYFPTGLSWALSSDETTLTAAGAYAWVEIDFAAAL